MSTRVSGASFCLLRILLGNPQLSYRFIDNQILRTMSRNRNQGKNAELFLALPGTPGSCLIVDFNSV